MKDEYQTSIILVIQILGKSKFINILYPSSHTLHTYILHTLPNQIQLVETRGKMGCKERILKR